MKYRLRTLLASITGVCALLVPVHSAAQAAGPEQGRSAVSAAAVRDQSPPALLAEPELRVVSWNICGEAGGVRGEAGYCPYRNDPQAKVDQIAQVVVERNANVVMLQEVCGEAPGSHMERLRAALGSGWSIAHAPGARTDGTANCRGGLSGTLGVGIAVKGRVTGTTATNTVPGGGDQETLPVLCVRVEGWSTRVCTTHILSDPADPRRPGQIQNVKNEIWPDRYQLVLGGDFNMFPDTAQLRPISDEFDECDRRSYGAGDTVNEVTHHSWDEKGGHIWRKRDHIFASWGESGSQFTSCEVDRTRMDTTENTPNSGPSNGYSDHAPIIGSLKPPRHLSTSGDFDGDGKADLAVLYGQGKTSDGHNRSSLWISHGSGTGAETGFAAPHEVWDSGADSWNWSASALTAGDFDGDGKTDLGVLYNYGKDGDRNRTALWTFKGIPNGFEAPRKVWDSRDDTVVPSWNWSTSKLVAGDFNGDGKSDVGVLYDYGKTDSGNRAALWTFTSNGGGFNSPKQVWDSSTDPVKSWNWAASKPVVGDFNGDGRADVGVLYDYGRTGSGNRTGLWTFTSTGGGFASPKQAWDSGSESWNWTASKPVAGDFNGDGRADIGVLYDYGRAGSGNRTGLWTFTSGGSGFGKPRLVWDSSTDPVKSWNWTVSEPVAGDFNGDGRADLAVMYDYGNAANGRNRTALWSFTGRGTDFAAPQVNWDSSTTQ
ncbi:FG-GAP-like repeat-containing protein [Streptomyces luteireticuli]|uniref:FG-GAP-like repeat-containing protein n=1 Tax=Streptomyces luteireticuli TaxID=173858 RepID=UPI0031D845B7